jgi:uncharacterized damage-inducible protein DinB
MTSTSELAAQLRGVPARVAACTSDVRDEALRARPAAGEWSAIEVVGHLIDKLEVWRARVQQTANEDGPVLDPYDQDELVRRANYQGGELHTLLASLTDAAERFASAVERLDAAALERRCRHGEYGDITLQDCITLPLRSVDEHLDQIGRAIRGEQ